MKMTGMNFKHGRHKKIDFIELLYKSGFKKHKIEDMGYIKQFDKTHRYHAYIKKGYINIHTDVFNESGFPNASKYKVSDEIQRLAIIRLKMEKE